MEGCSQVATVSVLGNVGDGAFRGCTALRQATLVGGTLRVGGQAFAGDESLERVDLPDGLAEIGAGAFRGCVALPGVTLPGSLRELGASAFEGCSSLRRAEVPGGVDGVPERAFGGCSALESVALGEGVRVVGPAAFARSGLHELVVPASVLCVCADAFGGCEALRRVAFVPPSPPNTDGSAFARCGALVEATAPISYFRDGVQDSPIAAMASLRVVTVPDFSNDQIATLDPDLFGDGALTLNGAQVSWRQWVTSWRDAKAREARERELAAAQEAEARRHKGLFGRWRKG